MLDKIVCNHLVSCLRNSIEGGNAAEYWIDKRKHLTESRYFQVDWEANSLTMKSSKVSRQYWVTKFESGMCGSEKMIKIWKH